jgi:sterol 3beta-glucosyltransferase
MSRVMIIAVGSRGDVAPLTGGRRRAAAGRPRRGHRRLHPVRRDDHRLRLRVSRTTRGTAAGRRRRREGTLAAVADEPADIVVLSPFAEMVGHPLAEAKGIPSLGVRLQPLSATADHPPAVLGGWSAGASGNLAAANWDCRAHRLAACEGGAPRHTGLSCTGIRRWWHRDPRTGAPD